MRLATAAHRAPRFASGLLTQDTNTGAHRHYDQRDGILKSLHNRGALFSSGGELYFGGENGLHIFRPDDIRDNSVPPQVAITGLKLFGEPVLPGEDSPLRRHISQTEEITLSHRQNDLSVDYAGLHFARPEKNRYAYTLEGYDSDWRDAGLTRTATYTNLSPGSYNFRVKAANADGLWNEEGRALAIVILPPWWLTIWAYVFYGIHFIGGIVAVDRVQRRRPLRREREAARERELQQKREIERAYAELKQAKNRLVQQEKMASLGALTAGIAHEIKNPLNFINNFAGVTKELVDDMRSEREREPSRPISAFDPDLDDLALNASKIEEHGRRADGIVRSMLEHSRGTKGERTQTDVNALVEECMNLAYHGMRAHVTAFECTTDRDYDEAAGEVEMVPQEVGRVFLNLLGNAFYAVHQKRLQEPDGYNPTVHVSTQRRDDGVEIRMEDNGPGIPDDVRDKIFEPFFTTKPTGEGTGLGLSLSYDIVTQSHGGSLSVESGGEGGAAFVVHLPG